MIKPDDPRELAEALLNRSTCTVQVAAVIADKHGIFAWGWNNVGDGFGCHAEAHAFKRANKGRLGGSVIFVASRRHRNGKIVPSKPCTACQALLDDYDIGVVWRDTDGRWI